MKPLHIAAALAAVLATTACAPGMGLGVYAPGPDYYGEVDMEFGVPPVIFAAPIVAIAGADAGPPIYLHVPPGYERHWGRHCHAYHACGRPVYFVRERWYQDVYAPRRYGRDDDYRRGDDGYRRGDDDYRRGDDRRDGGGGYYGQPGLGSQTPGGGYSQPGLGSQTPGGGYGQPGLRSQTPGGGYDRRRGDGEGEGNRGRGRGRGRDRGEDD